LLRSGEDLHLSLVMAGEWERFIEIEIPIQQIFWWRQYKGISFNKIEWDRAKDRVQKDKYDAFRKLALMMGTSPTSVRYQNVGRHLKGTDAEYLAEFADSPSVEVHFELAREHSQFAHSFVAFAQARKDESIILRIDPGQERTFPTFECFGTVTGRIIALNPALQSISRDHRHFVAADMGKSLSYLDYAQFEPGILAQLSCDQTLIRAYNSHDLYIELSMVLFGSTSRRSDAKRLFLAYSYGMSPDSMSRLISGRNASSDEVNTRKAKVVEFFSRYPGLEELRQNLLDELQDNGSISSLLGNHRRRVSRGRLSGKEQGWALSQRVQGTASLIFKDALIRISKAFGPEVILLPMHDAVLLQIRESEKNSIESEITAIMIASFQRWCPDIAAKVTSEDFASIQHSSMD
jgi:DNA polymerase-1